MLSPVKILRKTIVSALINRKTTINCEVLRKISVPCSLDMEHILPAPAFVSAEVGNVNLNTWVLTFDLDLDNIIPLVAENAFISAGFTFNSISKTAVKEIRLISDQDVVFGQVLTIQYNPALTLNPLQGTSGAKVAAFTESVTNNVGGAQIPIITQLLIEDADRFVIHLEYDIALDENSTPDISAFVLGSGRTISAVVISTTAAYIYVNSQYYWGDTETVAYTAPATNMIKSTGGGEAASFTATAVTNNIVIPAVLSDANAIFLYEFDDLTTITKDGSDFVSRWNDKNLSGRDLIQATGTNQPLWTADGILCDGIDNFMKTAAFTWNQPEFIYIAFKLVTYTNDDRITDGNLFNTGMIYQASAGGNVNGYAGAVLVGGNLSLDTFYMVRVLFNGASSKFIIDNGVPSTGNAGASNMGGFTLARRGSQSLQYGNIKVQGIIGRNLAPSAGDEIVMYNYFANKWGYPKI